MIALMTVLIAGVGITLLAALYSRIHVVNHARKLEKHRKTDAGLADLLIYAAMVDDGVIVGKNGAFMAAWIYRGEDNASASDEQRNQVSFRINQALAGLGNGWMLHVDAVRRPAPHYPERGLSHFPDAVTAAMDEERRQLFENLGTMYEGYFVLTLTWYPPSLIQRKFVELMFDDDTAPPDHKAHTTALIEHFKRECLTVESRLSTAIKLERLRGRKTQ
ncbi:MAG: conjugal transfer protein TrbE, partial [Nitrosospira sp.]